MDRFKAIKVNALWSVWNSRRRKAKDDDDYDLNKMLRWYSKTFHTPVQAVEELPIDHVVEMYWYENFEALDEEEFKKAHQEVVQDPDQLKELQKLEDEEEWETFLMRDEMIAENKATLAEAGIKKLEDATAALKDLTRDTPLFRDRDAQLVMNPIKPQDQQPDIKLNFDDVDEDSDPLAFGLMDPPKKRG